MAAITLSAALMLSACGGSTYDSLELSHTDIAPTPVASAAAPVVAPVTPAAEVPGAEVPVADPPVADVAAGSAVVPATAPLPQSVAVASVAAVPEPAPARPAVTAYDETQTASINPDIFRPAKLHPKFGDYKPFDFPNRKPTDYPVHGTDTSRWQPSINWPKVRSSGIAFAFIKATEGGDHMDPAFAKNWKAAKAAGVPRGAYHFYYFCTEPEVQARWYLRNVPRDKHSMPPVLDAEWNHQSRTCPGKKSPERVRRDLKIWLDIVEKETGKTPIIYTTPDFYDDNDMGRLQGYHFWLRSTAAHPTERYPHERWTFWQYTGTGKIPGIEGKADINVFRGSAKDWAKWLKANGVRG
ncbi:MAG: glycoside hydrolase family 25 protein [Rhizobiaceae bacterium]|jgi:lysozyme|nr:glycoside hydrolase family 25 protein [Rhizobiaceae bacterium]